MRLWGDGTPLASSAQVLSCGNWLLYCSKCGEVWGRIDGGREGGTWLGSRQDCGRCHQWTGEASGSLVLSNVQWWQGVDLGKLLAESPKLFLWEMRAWEERAERGG